MGLTANIQEAMHAKREQQALRAGVSKSDINFSRLNGLDPRDVQTFRNVSKKGFLIVVRCPKAAARGWHGIIPAKPISMKEKTGTSGVAVDSIGRMFVSDYDLMSIWRHGGTGWRKIFISAANGAPRGPYSPEGRSILKELNRDLISRIKHGCQDDFCTGMNPGVNLSDHFAVFHNGQTEYLQNPRTCKLFYERHKLVWLYNDSGKYLLDLATQQLQHG